jgi:hypothetical protein
MIREGMVVLVPFPHAETASEGTGRLTHSCEGSRSDGSRTGRPPTKGFLMTHPTASASTSWQLLAATTPRVKRHVASLAGLAGATVAGIGDAQAVPYTPTPGVAAAQGIPGFSFVDASSVTLGSLRPPDSDGTVAWDVDGNGTQNFLLRNSSSDEAFFSCINFSGFNRGQIGFNAGAAANLSAAASVPANVQTWEVNNFKATSGGDNKVLSFPTGTPGQLPFRFTNNSSDTFYGWASLTVDLAGEVGQGYVITEAYYQTTPGAGITVGAVPVPEPSSMMLLALGAGGVMAWRARRSVKAETEA